MGVVARITVVAALAVACLACGREPPREPVERAVSAAPAKPATPAGRAAKSALPDTPWPSAPGPVEPLRPQAERALGAELPEGLARVGLAGRTAVARGGVSPRDIAEFYRTRAPSSSFERRGDGFVLRDYAPPGSSAGTRVDVYVTPVAGGQTLVTVHDLTPNRSAPAPTPENLARMSGVDGNGDPVPGFVAR